MGAPPHWWLTTTCSRTAAAHNNESLKGHPNCNRTSLQKQAWAPSLPLLSPRQHAGSSSSSNWNIESEPLPELSIKSSLMLGRTSIPAPQKHANYQPKASQNGLKAVILNTFGVQVLLQTLLSYTQRLECSSFWVVYYNP